MTGLRGWERERSWPERAGDAGLVPPGEDELLALVCRHALRDGAASPLAATWVYARWKPGVSICAAYELAFDGSPEPLLVVLKRYADDKARELAERPEPEPREDSGSPLRGSVVLPEQRSHLWTEWSDRALPGLGRLLDMRRTKRLLAEQGVFAPLQLRSHRSGLTRLRYRPERRAVLRLDAALRGSEGCALTERLGVRALTPDTAARVARRRRALGHLPGLPDLLAAEERTGLLFEQWFDGLAALHDPVSAEPAAGQVLAALHAAPAPSEAREVDGPEPTRALLGWDPALAGLLSRARAGFGATAAGPSCWVHGDFHLDQLARSGDGRAPLLLDLDALAPGEAGDDLASWIADRLADEPQLGFGDAACGLLEAYEQAGGRTPRFPRLRELVVRALVDRAEGCLRRLERDAVDRAAALLGRAIDLGRVGAHSR